MSAMSGPAVSSHSAGLSSYYSMKPNNVLLQVRDAVKQSDALLWLPPASRTSSSSRTPGNETPSSKPTQIADKKNGTPKYGAMWRWSGFLSGCQLVCGLSWGVTCLMTDCKENQDGWTAQFLGSKESLVDRSSNLTRSSVNSERKNVDTSHSYETCEMETSDPKLGKFVIKSLRTTSSTVSSRAGSPLVPFGSSGLENQENLGSCNAEDYTSTESNVAKCESSQNSVVECEAGSVKSKPSLVFSFGHELSALAQQVTNARCQPKLLPDQEPIGMPVSVESATFVVLDGHGIGGRDAAAALERAFDHVYTRFVRSSKHVPVLPDAPSGALMNVLGLLHESFSLGQTAIEKLNMEQNRDFGTTCVTVSIAEDFLLSTSCGDSSAYLFAFAAGTNPPKSKKTHLSGSSKSKPVPGQSVVVIELTRKHSLTDVDELARIEEEGQGRVIRGDNNILRLIPRNADYDEAKRRGLSINMSRSLGHQIFSNFGLSNLVDYSFLSLRNVYKLLEAAELEAATDFQKHGKRLTRHIKLSQLSFAECAALIPAALEKSSKDQIVNPLSNHISHPKRHSRGGSGSRLFATCIRRTSHDKQKPSWAAVGSSSASPLFSEDTSGLLTPNSPRPHAKSETVEPMESLAGSKRSGDISPRPGLNGYENRDENTNPEVRNCSKMRLFLLLMSDGITDVMSINTIADFLQSHDKKYQSENTPFSCSSFSYSLANMAKESRLKTYQRADNCTCLCVDLSGNLDPQ